MKKGTFFMMLAAAASLASCTAQGPKANLKSDVDSLSYMMGVTNTQGLMEYVQGRLGVDSAYVADFIKGLEQGCKETDAKQKAYLAGMQIGQQVSGDMFDYNNRQIFGQDSTQALNKDNFLAGFIAAVKKQSIVTTDSASAYVRLKAELIKSKALEAKYADYKKQKQYKIITKGTGALPADTSRVKVNYKGTMIDGTEFDSSKEPITLAVNRVIPGWTEALKMMPVGSKWELYIPQELGYGAQEAGKIKPFSTLI